jgi:hypothetical protein
LHAGELAFKAQPEEAGILTSIGGKGKKGERMISEQIFKLLVGRYDNSSDLAWKMLAAIGEKVLESDAEPVRVTQDDKNEEKTDTDTNLLILRG